MIVRLLAPFQALVVGEGLLGVDVDGAWSASVIGVCDERVLICWQKLQYMRRSRMV